MFGVFLSLTGCHKEEPENEEPDNCDKPRIVWTEFIQEEVSSYYYDDYYDYQNYLEYHDYPEGTRVVAHYSDNSMTFFGYRWDDKLVCLGNRFGDTQVYELEIPETVIVRRKADSNGWCFDGYSVGEIDTLYVQIIEGGSFDPRITSLIIPSSFFYSGQYRPIESGAFVGCTSLHTITIPSGIETIPAHFFEWVFMRQYEDSYDHEGGPGPMDVSLILPEGLKTLEYGAFEGCTSLTNVVFPEGLESIGSGAFAGCSEIASLAFPSSLKSAGGAFVGCSSLRTVTFMPGWETIPEGAFREAFNSDGYVFYNYPNNYTVPGPSDVTLILPEGLKTIEWGAFEECTSLSNVVFPDGLESIGREAFAGCSEIASLAFPTSLLKVEREAFAGCSSLNMVVILPGRETISEGAFREAFNLGGYINYPDTVPGPSDLTVIISEGIKTIGNQAFEGCSSLKKVVFPNGLNTIEYAAFKGCTSLKDIVFPEIMERIQGGNFMGDGQGAFQGCSSLTRVVIPKGINRIENCLFRNCKSLTTVVLPEGIEQIDCRAFQDCVNLAIVDLPNSLQIIKRQSFANSKMLTNVVLPEGLVELEGSSFAYCSMVSCTSLSVAPPTVSFSFDEGTCYCEDDPFCFNYQLQAIYVPRESVDAYKAADGWNHYADIIYPIE